MEAETPEPEVGNGGDPVRYPESPMVVPDGWRQTNQPRSIAIIGWARLSEQGDQGSGYNLSASELASGLVSSGHRVVGLASGMRYSPVPGVRIEEDLRWRGVETYNVVNSPCVAPASLNFGNLAAEMSSPRLSACVVRWLNRHQIEIVHVHSLEGYSLDLIAAIRASGRPVVVTLHNYWFVCPQVDLLRSERSVCLDYGGGRACESCITTGAARTKRRRRAVSQVLMSIVGERATDVIRDGVDDLVSSMRGRVTEVPRFTPLSRSGVPLDAASGLSAGDGSLHPSLPPDAGAVDAGTEYEIPPEDANERVLSAGDRHCAGDSRFAERRRAGIAALNAASAVISPSVYLKEVHRVMGVDETLLDHVPLGQPHFDELYRLAASSPYYNASPWDPETATRPLRFAFHGTLRANKGLEVLARAIPLLSRDVLSRVQINIRALGHDTPLRRRLAAFPQVTFEGQYDLQKLVRASGTYDVGVLSHIWLENSPLVMWEHLYAGKLCVTPGLGGAVDVVKDGVNGAMFKPGDPEDLARVLTEISMGDRRVPSPKEIHAASDLHSYPEHVERIDGLYQDLLNLS